MWETQVRSLGQEHLLEKEMAIHSSILAWKIPWMEETGRLQSVGSQRVRHDWATSLFPASWSFLMSQLFPSGGQTTGASVSASVLPMNIHSWLPLGLTGLISLQSEGLSRVMSLHFKMLSRFVVRFYPRSKHLLILWLQSLSAVILEPRKIKSVAASSFSLFIYHEVMGVNSMILGFFFFCCCCFFLMLSFKPAFSLSSFTLIKKFFSSSSLSEITSDFRWLSASERINKIQAFVQLPLT